MNVELSKNEVDWIIRLSEEGADVKQTILLALNLLEASKTAQAQDDGEDEPEPVVKTKPVAGKPRGKKTKEPTPSA